MRDAVTPDITPKRADIQGLRGVAVLAVLLFHASHTIMPGGFAGVDIFFVISGYLITRILLRSLENGRFSLTDFYRHRVRRLFPALYAMLGVTLIAGLVLLPPKLLKELVFTQFFTSLFLSNFAFARLAGYFDSSASLKPLLHTWSLGVEEQFYLLFPLVLLAIQRFVARFLWPILIGLGVLSFVAAEMVMSSRPDSAFYLPTARAFELLIGSLCVGFERHVTLTAKLRRLLSVGGLVLVVLSLTLLRDTFPFPGALALLPCLGAACLLVSVGGWSGRLLSAPPLVWTGDLSYSLYLWHWPVLVFGRLAFGDSLWVTLPCLALSFGLAWVSRRFVELPFMEGRIRPVWLPAGAAMGVSILVALLIYQAGGIPGRFSAREQAAFAAAEDINPRRKGCHLAKDQRVAYAATCVWGDAKAPPSIAVWGDSHGNELAAALGQHLAGAHVAVRQITASACPPSVGFEIRFNPACREHNADTLQHLRADGRIKTVILTANYLRYSAEDEAAMLGGLEMSAMDLLSAGKQVVIVYPLPVYEVDPPSQAGMALRFGRDPKDLGMTRARFEEDNRTAIAELDAFTHDHGITSLRPSDVLCDAQACRFWDDQAGVLYFNGQHLNITGAGLLARSFVTADADQAVLGVAK